jgi:hypothetical protein
MQLDLHEFMTGTGEVREGELIRYWRKEVLQWHNTQALVDIYNEVMESGTSPVSVRWWQRMEKENRVPVDKKRRWVISTLLNLPPAYLGLTALSPLFPRQERRSLVIPTTGTATLDLIEYDENLRRFWNLYYSYEDTTAIGNILARIDTLQDAFLYGSNRGREQTGALLCNYLILFGNIRRYQGCASALNYLNKAVALARGQGYHELSAKALYLRGYTYLDRWILLRKTNRTDLDHALNDFRAAHHLVDTYKLGESSLESAICAEWGYALAHTAQDQRDRKSALDTIEKAGRIVNANGYQRDWYFFNVNTDWYLIDKADTLLALNWPKSALSELNNVTRGNARKRRRYLTKDLIEARAYINSGKIEVGVAYAEDSLETAQEVNSCEHLTTIVNIYEELRENRLYRTSPDVARLGVKLLKVRQPALFMN